MDKFIQQYYNGNVDKTRYDNALNSAASQIGVPSDWLSAIFFIETAFSMNPYEFRNPFGLGLIGFTDIAIKQLIIDGILPKGFVKEIILNYTIEQEMNLIVQYFKMNQKRFDYSPIQTLENMYLLVFWPAAIDKQDDYILQTSGLSAAVVAAANPVWDVNKDGKILAGEIRNSFRSKLPFAVTSDNMSPELEAEELKKKEKKRT